MAVLSGQCRDEECDWTVPEGVMLISPPLNDDALGVSAQVLPLLLPAPDTRAFFFGEAMAKASPSTRVVTRPSEW